MGEGSAGLMSRFFGRLGSSVQKFLFRVVSMGPIPNHIAFIMDGNRRYASKQKLKEGAGHKAGFLTLMSLLKYCYELEVKYITIFAFSIDNFKRRPEEVQYVMDLMQEKIEGLLKEESIVNQYGVRVYFVGNLKLLNEPVRLAAEKAMLATANNTRTVLLICLAYTSSDEIARSIQVSCVNKYDQLALNGTNHVKNEETKREEHCRIKLVDLDKNMHMSVAPDPDILIRSSGETRLSNFLLWQTTNCILCCPHALWPEIGLWHLLWAILNFQQHYSYMEKKKKQL